MPLNPKYSESRDWWFFIRSENYDGKFRVKCDDIASKQTILEEIVKQKKACSVKWSKQKAEGKYSLLVYCVKEKKDEALIELTKHFTDITWTWDNRKSEDMEIDRGSGYISKENTIAQQGIFRSLIRHWCNLLRMKGKFIAKYKTSFLEKKHTIQATIYKKNGLFSKSSVFEVKYIFVINEQKITDRSITIHVLRQEFLNECNVLIDDSAGELERLTTNIHIKH